jgi:hypothetical protein
MRKASKEMGSLPGPSFMSATAICFDWLMSLPERALRSVRKLKFYTNPDNWQHRRVFEFIARHTKIDDVEMLFATQKPWAHPWQSKISIPPWSSTNKYYSDVGIQKEVMNIYSLCKLTGLQRLAITMISRFDFWGPVYDDLRESQIELHANLMGLFCLKMLSRRALDNTIEPKFLTTSMLSRQPHRYGVLNQTIDHIHCDIADAGLRFKPAPPTISESPEREEKVGASTYFEYTSTCPICRQIESMRYERGMYHSEITGQQPFVIMKKSYLLELDFAFWPDDLSNKEFYDWIIEGDPVAKALWSLCPPVTS